MRISRWTWSTDRRPPHRRLGHLAAGRLERGEQLAMRLPRCPRATRCAGEPMIACWTSARSLCASSTSLRAFLEAAARAVEHRFDLDQAGGDVGFGHSSVSLLVLYWPGLGRSDVGAACSAAVRIWTVSGPLSTSARVGVPHLAADSDLRVVAAGGVEQAGLARAARRRAAEQGVDRLLLRFGRRQAGRAGHRRRQVEVGRDDQRRIARDREFVGRAAARSAMARSRWSSPPRPAPATVKGFTHVR